MAKKTRTELSTLAINTNLPDNTQELITPTTERSQLTDERESVVNYKDDLGGTGNAGKFLTVATDGESLTMVDAPTGDVTGTGVAGQVTIWNGTNNITSKAMLVLDDTSKVLKIIIPSENASGGISIDQQGTTGSGSLVFLDDGVYKAQIVYDVSDGNLTLNSNGDIEITADGDTVISGGTPIVENVRITSGGNVGIGVTPSAWRDSVSVNSVIQGADNYAILNRNDGGTKTNYFAQNFYYNASDVGARIDTGKWSLFYSQNQEDGSHGFYTSSDASGSAPSMQSKLTISSGGVATFKATTPSPVVSTPIVSIADSVNGVLGGIGARASGTYPLQIWGGTLELKTGSSSNIAAATTHLTISSGGDVLIGKTVANNDDVGLWFNPDGASWVTQSDTYCLGLNRKGTDGIVVLFTNDQATAGTISVSGTTTAYNTSSDYRLKENVTPITDALSRLNQLKPSRFNFIADTDKIVDGFIAHEVQDIIPEAICGEKDAMKDEEYEVTPRVEEVLDEEGNVITEAVEAVMETRSVPDYQGIDQSKIVPLLTAAIQEQQTIIETLITRLEALEA